ncbi:MULTISPECIES: DnaA N-terminal domain-containing protein [spotted fever group]|uniref:DnaA N-terminal domain-containing protein n=1 Tax=Rickettsia tamurae subsp. buchneri TaxID=1462938 RepID=A0A8E0WKG7_9RICK|nr:MULTISPECIES: DnaA N-terminal domain-containing protein [spotted fever group]EER20865.1 hypothetical protein REIS_2109 [Rickettsia endosymbiont of Ixodes scapularis]KDO02215.1 hypothetical protein REISMN_08085 [Rickettsia tamurae subsp. buchneri]
MNIPHNEQKHNSKPLPLQHLGNLAYHQSKSATSYDSFNSLTTHNTHYTLLYPDLVHGLFSFSLHNSNSLANNLPFLRNISVNNAKYSSLDSSLSSSLDSLLSPRDILFFLQIVSLYQLELSKGNPSITYPALKLAKLLGVDASCDTSNPLGDANMRATILKMTAKLESLGLLKVLRRKRSNGMDMANKLIPVLPDRLHAKIKNSSTNLKVCDSSKLDHESNLEHILRTKLFVPIELEFMKSLFKDSMPSKYKLFFLNCIISAYRNFRQNSNGSNMLSFSSTSRELIKKNNISRSTLDRIFRYIKQQGDSFFLKAEHKYTKSDDIDCNRYDKSIFIISINPLVFPISQIRQSQKEEISNINHDELQGVNSSIFPDTYEGFETAWSKKQPSIIIKTALNNKDIIIENKYSKNIDENLDVKNKVLDKIAKNNQIKPQTFLQTSNSEHLESEQSSLSSKSLKNILKDFMDALPLSSNATIEDASRTIKYNLSRKNKIEKRTVLHPKASNDNQNKELRHFYPLSEKDVSILNLRANREFSVNFVNQLLLKLYIKYSKKRFKNKFTFLSYMQKALKNEKHQGPLVNHTTFRFSCNINAEEKNLLEYEKYLNEIEHSFDTSKEIQLKKKISGRFNTEIAYKILTQVEFKTNQDNSFITALIPSSLDLSEKQIEILSEQLEAVYGINGYYVPVVRDEGSSEGGIDTEEQAREAKTEVIYPNATKPAIVTNSETVDILTISGDVDTINENTSWHQIRKRLRTELGEAIDTAWFSKAVVKECKETNILTITMPTRFMADWIRNNYSQMIRRLAGNVGVKRVEYGYDISSKW